MRDITMKRPLPFVGGVIVALLGLLFTLQGFGVVSGSSMSNTTTWSILGPIIVIIGVGLIYRGTRVPAPAEELRPPQ
jgi:amino acid transporter